MIRTINIEGQKADINSSAGWLYVYRNQFGHDILPDLMPVIESVIGAIASVLEESGGVFNEKTLAKAMNNDALVDAFIKMAGMQVLTIFNIFWAMAKNADGTIPGPEDYFNSFDRFPVDEIVPELFYAIVDSSVSSKNATRLLQRIKNVKETTEEQ